MSSGSGEFLPPSSSDMLWLRMIVLLGRRREGGQGESDDQSVQTDSSDLNLQGRREKPDDADPEESEEKYRDQAEQKQREKAKRNKSKNFLISRFEATIPTGICFACLISAFLRNQHFPSELFGVLFFLLACIWAHADTASKVHSKWKLVGLTIWLLISSPIIMACYLIVLGMAFTKYDFGDLYKNLYFSAADDAILELLVLSIIATLINMILLLVKTISSLVQNSN